jgi:hypothetical protein
VFSDAYRQTESRDKENMNIKNVAKMPVNFQRVYEVPLDYTFVAINGDGVLCGFRNPPVRDFEHLEWIDSTDGSTGEIILYEKWETSCREVSDLPNMNDTIGGYVKRQEGYDNAELIRMKNRERLSNPHLKGSKK